jgi:ubiquitin thioesterase protein OTUB1
MLTLYSGHYDILYKTEDVPQPMQQQQQQQQQQQKQQQQQTVPAQPPLQVNLANYTDDFVPTASRAADIMTLIPGMYPTGFGQQWASLSYDFSASPAPQPQVAPVLPYASAPTPATPVSSSQLDYIVPSHSSHASQYNPPSHHSLHLDQPPVTLAIHPSPAPPVSIDRATPATADRGGPFRPSMYELEPGFGSGMQVQPFQTSIFRK